MAKEQVIQTTWLTLIMIVVSFSVAMLTRLYGSGEASGALIAKVDGNTLAIKRMDESGTKIMQEVRIDLSQIVGRISRNESEIASLKTNLENQYNTIINLLSKDVR